MKILSLSGFVPEQICDTVRFKGYVGDRNISHYCGYANDFISQVINDDSVDGAVFPKSCDSSRVISSYIEDSKKFFFQLNVPARADEFAIEFFAKEIEVYKSAIEKNYGIAISRNEIVSRIDKINKRNSVIGTYYDDIEKYSYGDYLRMIHDVMTQPLINIDLDFNIRDVSNEGKRVFVIGSYLCNENIAEKMEEVGFNIVGDNLPESGRIANSIIADTDNDIYKAIAQNILARRLSPTQNNFSLLIDSDFEEIKAKKAEAVIFITQKYCEPYDYLYSLYKKKLDEKGIPSLKISLTDSQDDRKTDLMLEAFAGVL